MDNDKNDAKLPLPSPSEQDDSKPSQPDQLTMPRPIPTTLTHGDDGDCIIISNGYIDYVERNEQ